MSDGMIKDIETFLGSADAADATMTRPRIWVSPTRNPRDILNDIHKAIKAVNSEKPTLFRHNGMLVEYQPGADEPETNEVDATRLSKWCIARMDFLRPSSKGGAGKKAEGEDEEEGAVAGPPDDNYIEPPFNRLREYCVAEELWRELPELAGIVRLPIIRADGTFVTEGGWDSETKYFYEPMEELRGGLGRPVPENPTKAQIEWAIGMLRDEILGDFEFLSEADRANAIGSLLSPMLRFVYACPQPIHMCTAYTPGTGKSLLSEAIGVTAGSWEAVPYDVDEEEMRKKITSTLLSGSSRVVVFDNVKEGVAIESTILAKLSTDNMWNDRKLGGSTTVRVPNDRLWMITGNALQTGGDIARRAVWIVQDSGVARPEHRPATTFKYPNRELIAVIKRDRASFVLAMLVLVQAWKVAGGHSYEPSSTIPRMGGFEPWVRVIGGILEVAGVKDFLGNSEERRSEDDEADIEGTGLLTLLEHYFGREVEFTPGDASAKLLELADYNGTARLIGGTLVEMTLPGSISVRCVPAGSILRLQSALGKWLKAHEKRPFGENAMLLKRRVDSHTKSSYYRVSRLGSAEVSGTSGT